MKSALLACCMLILGGCSGMTVTSPDINLNEARRYPGLAVPRDFHAATVKAQDGSHFDFMFGDQTLLSLNIPATWTRRSLKTYAIGAGDRCYYWGYASWQTDEGALAKVALRYFGQDDLFLGRTGEQRVQPGTTLSFKHGPAGLVPTPDADQ